MDVSRHEAAMYVCLYLFFVFAFLENRTLFNNLRAGCLSMLRYSIVEYVFNNTCCIQLLR